MGTPDVCLVGKIVGAVGIAGGVRIFSHSDIPGRFTLLDDVLLGRAPSALAPYHVRRAEESGDRIVLYFDGVATRNDAEALRDMEVYITSDRMLPPPPGKHFIHDLIGCRVVNERQEFIGLLADVVCLPANDVYVIGTPRGDLLIPAVPEFVLAVDIPNKVVTVVPDENLYEDAPDEN